MRPVISKLEETGTIIEDGDDYLKVIGPKELKSIDIKTLPYPGFPTDMQAQFMAMMTQCAGTNIVMETVFENRFMHVDEFNKMGANITVEGKSAIINGKANLKGSIVKATDLRCGAALILAALVAEGRTEIQNTYHIDRGYENFEEKFRNIGANIWREKN